MKHLYKHFYVVFFFRVQDPYNVGLGNLSRQVPPGMRQLYIVLVYFLYRDMVTKTE